MPRFYVLRKPGPDDNDSVTDYEFGNMPASGEAPLCNACGHPSALREWLSPFEVRLRLYGKRFGDLAFGSKDLLVSRRFLALFKEEGLRGLSFLGKAKVEKVTPRAMSSELPEYYVARVARTRAAIDHEASGSEFAGEHICENCLIGDDLQRFKRIVIVENTWEGDDVFIARGMPGLHLVSERFKEFCEKYQITNVKLVDALDFSIDWHPQNE